MGIEPGTGTQYMVIAQEDPSDEEIERVAEEEGMFYEEAVLSLTQEKMRGRVWQCGGTYWDTMLNDLVTLTDISRKSSWCDTEIKDAPAVLHFEPEHFNEIEVRASKAGLCERFLPRHNVPFRPPP